MRLLFFRPRAIVWMLALIVTWLPGSPVRAECPAGAPSCTAPFATREIEWPMVPDALCADLGGALYQAQEEEPFDGLIGSLIYHPVDADGFLLPGPLPLALLVPGNTHQYIYYEDLLTHLAGQGIVAVSLRADPSAAAGQRADVLLCGLRNMVANWTASHLNHQVALLGHSRGGEAAVMAANRHRELVDLGASPADDVVIRAVVAIAPSANCANGVGGCTDSVSDYDPLHAQIQDGAARSLLVIQGTRDGDVPGGGLRIYEDASREGTEPQADDLTKAMIWVYSVSHHSWGGRQNGSPDSKALVLARAYVGSYLRWWLQGRVQDRRFFTGEVTPPCVADPAACGLAFDPPETFPQYREGGAYGGDRLRIHDFEAPQPLDPSHLGPVHNAPVGSAHIEDLLTYSDPFARNVSTEAAIVTLSSDRESEIRFKTVNSSDLSSYAFLSVRLGKVVLKLPGDTEADCAHEAPGDLAVDIALKDWTESEHEVSSSDYQRVTDADIYWQPTLTGFAACDGNIYLTTLRIPLLDFWQGGVNPHTVDEIILRFGRSPANGSLHEVMVDSVELTINTIDAHCGNEVVEGDEVCDVLPPPGASCEDYGFLGGALGCSSACLPDTSACIEAVCGNGIVEGDEECDDGNLSEYDDCNPDCTACPAGEPRCRCLGSRPGEEDPALPFDGVLGDGTYCHDDVLYGGLNRCVEMVGGNQACIPCFMDQGPFCPCDPDNNACFADYDLAYGSDITHPNPPADADMQCSFGLKDPSAPDALAPALAQGYCFANHESEAHGGAPPWFLEWYCQSWYPGAFPEYDPDYGDLCMVP